MMAVTSAVWVLIVATHVCAGSVVNMFEFEDQIACEYAAKAARAVSNDADEKAHTWCVPKRSK